MPIRSALVTGASGFIGRSLVTRLVGLGVPTYALARDRDGLAAESRVPPGAVVLPVRPESPEALRRVLSGLDAETVFHLASAGVRQGEDPERVLEGNVALMGRVLSALAGRPPRRFIYSGSCFEYGDGAGDGTITEATAARPLSVYAAAKHAAYHCGRALAASMAVPFVSLRLFCTYGPGEAPHRLVSHLVGRLARSEPVDLSPGDQVRDFVHVHDVVDAMLAAAVADALPEGAAFNVCTGVPSTVREVGELVADLMGRPRSLLRWGALPHRPDEAPRIVGCPGLFCSWTGWSPRISLRDGVSRLIEHRAAA